MTAPDNEYLAALAALVTADEAGNTGAHDALADAVQARYDAMRDAGLRSGSTTNGAPYPDPTDPVTEGANAIRALAQVVDPHLQRPQTAARSAGGVVNPAIWADASAVLPYPFQTGGIYLIQAIGAVSLGGSNAALTHRLRAGGNNSPGYVVTATVDVAYSLAMHWLYTATATGALDVAHQVFANNPATGVVVNAGHTVTVMRLA